VEYYGPLSNFNGSGVGIASLGWDKIYICNGQIIGGFATPDKRGRIDVGAIQGVPGGALDPVIAPGGFNPNYSLYTTAGSNSVTLSTGQMPSHTHVVTINDPGHRHVFGGDDQVATQGNYTIVGSPFNYDADSTTSGVGKHMFTKDINVTNNLQTTGITVNPVGTSGNNEAHNNIPPVLACYYIMYIP
jgi:microcystin-dependent protein